MLNNNFAIRTRHLGKKYLLGGSYEQYLTVWDAIVNSLQVPFKKFYRSHPQEGFWALKEISFDIEKGDVVGIVGRNGAGKSTLLKILSRITPPTTGTVEIKGRVGSLLEVGTGFHPEMTGRENIFLNGSILGMQKSEIEQKFDEIVKFSEIEKFLDTPVKRYSSGMYVRLAFAIAAHLEPEILIVDEVLAVGDAGFQKKCLGKMGEASKEGRTVLFVSHNMQAIRQLCKRAVLLDSGKVTFIGNVDDIIAQYLNQNQSIEKFELMEFIQKLPNDAILKVRNIFFNQNNKNIGSIITNANPLEIVINYQIKERVLGFRLYIDVYDTDDLLLFRSFHDEQRDGIEITEPGEYISKVMIPANVLGPIKYEFRIQAGIYNVRNCIPSPGIIVPLSVENSGNYNKAYLGDTFRGKLGMVLDWETQKI